MPGGHLSADPAETIPLSEHLPQQEQNQFLSELSSRIHTVLDVEDPDAALEDLAGFLTTWRRLINFRNGNWYEHSYVADLQITDGALTIIEKRQSGS